MLARDPVFGHVRVDHGASLEEELPQQRLADLLVQAADVDGGILTGRDERKGRQSRARTGAETGAESWGLRARQRGQNLPRSVTQTPDPRCGEIWGQQGPVQEGGGL